jgi:FMN phosphatase YigB (HAD superfamily)
VSARYRAALFDLFGTLVHLDGSKLPETIVDGRPLRSTSDAWAGLLADAVPGLALADFVRALIETSVVLDRERRTTGIEYPSRERFRRALVRAGCSDTTAEEVGPLISRAHMRRLASVAVFPPEHAAVLDRVAVGRVLGVVSNFDDTATAYDILARHGILSRVGAVVVSEAIGLRKPSPVLVRLALRELDVAPADAVMIGDHAVEDVGAANGAGVDAIWIDDAGTGVADGNPAPRWIVRSLAEVVGILG